MTPAEPEKANLIALTHARTALRPYADPPGRRCYTPPEQRNNTPIAAVSHLSPRWPRVHRRRWSRNEDVEHQQS